MAVPATAQLLPADSERFLQAVASGAESDPDSLNQLPQLIGIVEQGQQPDLSLAIRALTRLRSQAAPAVHVLCVRLGDSDYATRGLAIDALVAIGEAAVVPLRELLDAASGRARSAATEALGRLQRIEISDLDRLAKDSDPRVRAAVARALSHVGQPGVPRLAPFLADEDLAVAVEAARALQSNREDPATAVPALTEAVSRPHLGCVAADALAAYGVAARRAVPMIIRHYPLGHSSIFGWDDAAEETLEHIGPPDVQDVAVVCACLNHENAEARILAARSLARMEVQGRSAATALEAAAKSTLQQYRDAQRTRQENRGFAEDNSGRMWVAVEECAAAVWHVTHDADRFVSLLEQVVAGEETIWFSSPTPWQGFTANDCPFLERALRNANTSTQITALYGVAEMGREALPLQHVVLELVHADEPKVVEQSVRALAAMGPGANPQVTQVLLDGLRGKTIPLYLFASAIESLDVRSEQIEAILSEGLTDRDRSTACACAAALCGTSSNPSQTAAKIVELARDGQFEHLDAMLALRRLVPVPDIVLPYLIDRMSSPDTWTRHAAMIGVGDFRQAGAPATAALKQQLDDEHIANRLQAGCAIYLISGDAACFEPQLQAAFAGQDQAVAFQALETIVEMGEAGAPFLRHVTAAMQMLEFPPTELVMTALRMFGTAEAKAALEEYAASTDWDVRSQATAALRELRHAEEGGGT
jgi:HEAT repeat protein